MREVDSILLFNEAKRDRRTCDGVKNCDKLSCNCFNSPFV